MADQMPMGKATNREMRIASMASSTVTGTACFIIDATVMLPELNELPKSPLKMLPIQVKYWM